MTTLITLVLAPLILLTLGFAVELLAGIRPLRDAQLSIAAGASAVIIVPAHDEEELLRDTLAKLKEAGGSARILVVADNCRDATAAARQGFCAGFCEKSFEIRAT